MHHHVTSLVWQCSMTQRHLFEMSDSILPVSRYVTITVELFQTNYIVAQWTLQSYLYLKSKSGKKSVQRLYYYMDALQRSYLELVYFNSALCIYVYKNDRCLYSLAWNRNGRFGSDTLEFDIDCKKCIGQPKLDTFFKSFLRFRRIRLVRSTESDALH